MPRWMKRLITGAVLCFWTGAAVCFAADAANEAGERADRTAQEGDAGALIDRRDASGTGAVSSVLGWGGTNRAEIDISWHGTDTINFEKQKFIQIRGVRGRDTYISSTAGGGLAIQEPDELRPFRLTPLANGAVRVRTPDNGQFLVRADGSVRSVGRQSGRSQVTTSRDGKSITIWGADGTTYKIPMPGK